MPLFPTSKCYSYESGGQGSTLTAEASLWSCGLVLPLWLCSFGSCFHDNFTLLTLSLYFVLAVVLLLPPQLVSEDSTRYFWEWYEILFSCLTSCFPLSSLINSVVICVLAKHSHYPDCTYFVLLNLQEYLYLSLKSALAELANMRKITETIL